MITLKQLKWSNCFSYGQNNHIDFTQSPLVQLVGKNGHGKSSIALILEEVLYNKNSKGIKKADILNRYTRDNYYEISLTFSKNTDEYQLTVRRAAQQTVKLVKNGLDISGHTATTTYKLVEQIIGIDHKTFTQIVYQSHAGSLEFLTSADTARKRFLIELLNLTRYTETGEQFKKLAQELEVLVAGAEAKTKTVQDWIDKYSRQDLTVREMVEVPELDHDLIVKASEIEHTIKTIAQENKRISQNNTYKALQAQLKVLPVPEKPEQTSQSFSNEKAVADRQITDAKAFIKKLNALGSSCPTCFQNISADTTQQLIAEQQKIIQTSQQRSETLALQIKHLDERLTAWQTAAKAQEDWEKYYQLINTGLPSELLDQAELEARLFRVRDELAIAKKHIEKLQQHNKQAVEHNNRVELVQSQLAEMQAELTTWSTNLVNLTARLSRVGILVKTFSTTGLVAYKIENLIKDLESLTNEYLQELSSGRFQLAFEMAGNDKLNVVIVDNGKNIDIQALSGGERARVNVASLLAIRKLMQSLSQNRINLLILDETVETLDVEGKEKLVEVLLAEQNLNTLLVSHGFTHPLLEKVQVVKHKNISRIEE